MITDIFQPDWYYEKYDINSLHPVLTDGVETARLHKLFTSRVVQVFLKDPVDAMLNGLDIYAESGGNPYDPTKGNAIIDRMSAPSLPLTVNEIRVKAKTNKSIEMHVPSSSGWKAHKLKIGTQLSELSEIDVMSRTFGMLNIKLNPSVEPTHRELARMVTALEFFSYIRNEIIKRHTKKWLLATFISSSKVWFIPSPKLAGLTLTHTEGRCFQCNYTSLDIFLHLTFYHSNVINKALATILRGEDAFNKQKFNPDLISVDSATITNLLDMIDSCPSELNTLERNGGNPQYSYSHRSI